MCSVSHCPLGKLPMHNTVRAPTSDNKEETSQYQMDRNMSTMSHWPKMSKYWPVPDAGLLIHPQGSKAHPCNVKRHLWGSTLKTSIAGKLLTLPLTSAPFLQASELIHCECNLFFQGTHECIERNFCSAFQFVLSSVWLFMLLLQ